MVKSFLEERKLCVKINETTSTTFSPEQGTPQGSPLSPLLFNIFCYDIPKNNSKDQYLLQYADDTIIISHGKTVAKCIKALQLYMDRLITWFYKWRLHPNPEKSKFIIFNHKIRPSSPLVQIDNRNLTPSPSIKYLGIQIDCKLNMKLQSNISKKKTIARAKHFKCLTYKNEGISIENATRIYKSVCRPILEYGHTLYANATNSVLKNLEVGERTSLRTITRMRHPLNKLHNPSNELLYRKTKIQPITERLKILNGRFLNRVKELEDTYGMFHRDRASNPLRKFPAQTIMDSLSSMAVLIH